jgi:hypothetical protein
MSLWSNQVSRRLNGRAYIGEAVHKGTGYGQDSEACWQVKLDGDQVTWVKDGKEDGTGTIVKGTRTTSEFVETGHLPSARRGRWHINTYIGVCEEASSPASFGDHYADVKRGRSRQRITFPFRMLSPPYFFRAVRSFGEYGAERHENWPYCRFRSQEPHAKKPANTGDFRRSIFGERDLPRG